MLPPAPGRFSIMTVPKSSCTFSASTRAVTSIGPPAENGTTMRVTHSCATAGAQKVAAAMTAARLRMIEDFMVPPVSKCCMQLLIIANLTKIGAGSDNLNLGSDHDLFSCERSWSDPSSLSSPVQQEARRHEVHEHAREAARRDTEEQMTADELHAHHQGGIGSVVHRTAGQHQSEVGGEFAFSDRPERRLWKVTDRFTNQVAMTAAKNDTARP